MDIQTVLQFIVALEPLVAPTVVTVESAVAAIKAAGGMTDATADVDLTALITEALAAKAARDVAAAGGDPQ
jgi:hypothetical protein